ncbi:helix-turn-helix domain-containing protein [Cryptosporangium phraense]|uniref:helix-turn-helix domain-containing protein n=1 Tax=Cryptosporangium phraense TaxID=2593070 RepID=UPI003B846A70
MAPAAARRRSRSARPTRTVRSDCPTSDAARTSSRAVQNAFRRHYDTTPLGYLRQIRLDRARRELQAADPSAGDTVAAIALRWGFGAPGRFSHAYRARYGQPPSRTLRR